MNSSPPISPAEVAIGIDVGGTKIAGVVVRPDGSQLAYERRPTPADDGQAITDVIVELVETLSRANGMSAVPVGVGAAGMVDTNGTIIYAPNLSWNQFPLREHLTQRLQVPVVVANDANVAVWGEFRVGAAREVRGSVVMLTLGTGVGGGLVVGDRLALGSFGMGAEFGHIIVHEGGRQCPCGNRGCLEAYASGSAIGRTARKRLDAGDVSVNSALHGMAEVTGTNVTTAAKDGDTDAIAVLAECGTWLGVGVASLINALDPATVIIGGGAMQAGAFLLDPAREACAARLLGGSYRRHAPIVQATLGSRAGGIGAALLALEQTAPP